VHRFRRAVEARDHAAMVDALSDDVVLHSPVLFHPFEGRDTVSALLRILMDVLEDFHYTDELVAEDGTTGLVFRARVGDKEIEGIDLLRHGAEGQIDDFTVIIRPLRGLQAAADAVGARLDELPSG